MSIISDALKKIEKQAKKEPQSPQFNAAGLKEAKNSERKAPKIFASKKFLVLFCIFVLVIVFVFILNPPGSRSSVRLVKSNSLGGADDSSALQASPAKANSSPFSFENIFEPVKSRSGFELSGIMLSKEGPVAIINNEIVKQGDVINGASVYSIKEDSVKLSYQGQEFILSVK